MKLTPEQQRKADGDMRSREQFDADRRASSLARLLGKAKTGKRRSKP
jgi:hypothetical protein